MCYQLINISISSVVVSSRTTVHNTRLIAFFLSDYTRVYNALLSFQTGRGFDKIINVKLFVPSALIYIARGSGSDKQKTDETVICIINLPSSAVHTKHWHTGLLFDVTPIVSLNLYLYSFCQNCPLYTAEKCTKIKYKYYFTTDDTFSQHLQYKPAN